MAVVHPPVTSCGRANASQDQGKAQQYQLEEDVTLIIGPALKR